MKSPFQLEIPKRNVKCSHKGEKLEAGMDIFSALTENEGVAFARRDYCISCWKHLQSDNTFPETKVSWKSKIESRKPSPDLNRYEKALFFLREMLKSENAKEEEIFVLCLYLSHARQIALRQEFRKEEKHFHLYEILKQDEFITIRSFSLSSDQISEIQKSLASKFNS